MRHAFAKSLVPVCVAALIALVPIKGAFSEDAQFENAESEGSQIVAAGISSEEPSAKNLNTVPLDGFSSNIGNGGESRLVRQLMAARPNEDLVICIAGCFSGRDRVVYAQPIDKTAGTSKPTSVSVLNKQAANGASDGTSGAIAQSLRASQ